MSGLFWEHLIFKGFIGPFQSLSLTLNLNGELCLIKLNLGCSTLSLVLNYHPTRELWYHTLIFFFKKVPFLSTTLGLCVKNVTCVSLVTMSDNHKHLYTRARPR